MVGSLKIRVKPKLQIGGVNKPGTNRPSPVVTMHVIMNTHADKRQRLKA